MKYPLVLMLDALLWGSTLGLLSTAIAVLGSLLQAASGRLPEALLSGASFWVFVVSIGVSFLLTTVMLIAVFLSAFEDDWRRRLWKKILIVNAMVTGPAAYYLSYLRPSILNDRTVPMIQRVRRNRILLDCLSAVAVWTAAAVALIFATMMVLPPSHLTFTIAIVTLAVAISLGGTSEAVFFTIMLADLAQRSEDQVEELRLLRLLNPWAWVFGVRTYYFRVVRPELLSA